jgi:hypothetical protein
MNNQEKLLVFLKGNPKAGVDAIVEGTGIHKLQVFKILKALVEKDKSVIMEKEEFGFVYSANIASTNEPKKGKEVASKKGAIMKPVPTKPVKEEETSVPSPSGKDFTKYKLEFDGTKLENLTKGRLAYHIVRLYVEKTKTITLKSLKEIFPDSIVKINAYGLVQDINYARKKSETRDRYFLKPEELIKLKKENKTIAVCNQISKKEIDVIIPIARKLGMKIK